MIYYPVVMPPLEGEGAGDSSPRNKVTNASRRQGEFARRRCIYAELVMDINGHIEIH